eukprot:IDg22730t1
MRLAEETENSSLSAASSSVSISPTERKARSALLSSRSWLCFSAASDFYFKEAAIEACRRSFLPLSYSVFRARFAAFLPPDFNMARRVPLEPCSSPEADPESELAFSDVAEAGALDAEGAVAGVAVPHAHGNGVCAGARISA